MSDWLIRPGELMPQGAPGFGVWDGRNFHDGERGSKLDKMQPTHPGHLCPHKLNPQNCLTCYHARASAPPPPKPVQKRAPQVQTDPVVASVKSRAGFGAGAVGELVPHVDAPVHLGKTPDGKDIAPPERKPTRGPMPRPVITMGGPAAPGTQQLPRTVEPFSYANNQGRTDSRGVWHPAKHRELIDSLPRHPDAPKR